MLKKILESPRVYQLFQQAGGFFGARVKGIAAFIKIEPGQRVIDIGCGPGYILECLPDSVEYIGLDIDSSYIEHAKARFKGRGQFFCRYFDAAAAEEFGPADWVMMNGVLHHIPDEELVETLRNVKAALKPGGKLFTLDGCYRPGQSSFRKWMLDNDRGRFVRDEAGYRRVLSAVFPVVDLHIRENYSHVPYTFAIGVSTKEA